MPLLAGAVAVVGALCLVDLLLTLGIIRRLRENTAMLNEHRNPGVSVSDLSAGETPSQFTAVSSEGQKLSGPVGLRMAAFFSSSCPICPERVPAFVDYLRGNDIGRDRVLAVVLGPPDTQVLYTDRLGEVASVCAEPYDSELAKAFKVTGYPAFCLLDADGSVQAVSFDPAELPQAIAA